MRAMAALPGVLCAAFLAVTPLRAEEKDKPHPPYLLPLRLLKPFVWNIQRGTLKLTDTLNKNEPFEDFTRPPDIKDPRPLKEKSDLFEKEIETDFLRDGGRLFWHKIPNDTGDMAIWQGYYTAFRAFQYAATRSSHSRQYLKKALEGMALLQGPYGKAYLVRGVDPVGGDALKHRFAHSGEKAGKPYHWVDDPSGSSLSGYVFGLYCAYIYGDPESRAKAKELIVKIASNLIHSDYRLRNTDGRPSRFGSHSPNQWLLNPHRILTAIALLELAHMASGDEWFLREKRKIISTQAAKKIAGRGEVHLLWFSKAHHQHLVFMNFFVLMGTEQEEDLRGSWGGYFKRLMEHYRKEGNSFFIYSYGAYFPLDEKLRSDALKTLSEFSFPKASHSASNSKDITIKKIGRWSAQPLPVWKRPNTDVVWQRDPYQLDGNSTDRHTGVDFLIAYWMGRYFGFIGERE